MKSILSIIFLGITITMYGQWNQLGNDIEGTLEHGCGSSTAISGNGTTVITGCPDGNGSQNTGGFISAYSLSGNSWIQIDENIFGLSNSSRFGQDVSVNFDGSIIAGSSYTSGYVQVFENINGNWEQLGNDILGEQGNDESGRSIQLSNSGNIIAIGAPNNNPPNGNFGGHVRVFTFNGDDWVQMGIDIDGEEFNSGFGWVVSLNAEGNILAVGTPGAELTGGQANGLVQVFAFNGTGWVQRGQDIWGDEGALIGQELSLNEDGNVLALGIPFSVGISSGSAQVLRFQNNNWTQLGQAMLGSADGDRFGRSVRLNSSGDIIAITSINNDQNGDTAGKVEIFTIENNNWSQVGDDILGENAFDAFGSSAGLSWDGSRVAIGSTGSDVNGNLSGVVRVFENQALNVEENESISVSIFPNPSGDIVSIQTLHRSLEKVYLYDLHGREVSSQLIASKKIYSLNLSTIVSGTYFLKIKTSEGEIIKRIIKK